MKEYGGEVPLGQYADYSSARLDSTEVIVFWYYGPRGENGESLGEYGGFLTVGGTKNNGDQIACSSLDNKSGYKISPN
jgi:hypothetical protein